MDDSPVFKDLLISRPSYRGPSIGRAAAITAAISFHLALLGALVLSPFLVLEIMDPPKAKSFVVTIQQPRTFGRRPSGGAGRPAAIRKGGGAVRRAAQPAIIPIAPPRAQVSHPMSDPALASPSNPIEGAPPGPGLPDGTGNSTGTPDGCRGCDGPGDGTDPTGGGVGTDVLKEWDPRVTPPVLIPASRALPKYPDLARRARLQGTVILSIVIEADGTVGEVQVVRSPDQRWGFDLAAIEAVKQWRYRPALMHGQAVAVQSEVMVEFVLSM